MMSALVLLVACAMLAAASAATVATPSVLILTPLKDSSPYLDGFFASLQTLSFPHSRIGVAFLESDSNDDGATRRKVEAELPRLRQDFRKALYFQRDFGYALQSADRHSEAVQTRRRSILARSRNSLLTQALDDADTYVLWLDVDVTTFPVDLIEQLLAVGKEIVQPHVKTFDGKRTYDMNSWKETRPKDWYLADASLTVLFEGYNADHGRLHMDALELAGVSPVTLDGVGGAVLLVNADVHRRGLLFPASPYKKHIETEAFAIKARDWGYQIWGLPMLEVRHAPQAGDLAAASRLERALSAAQGTNSRPHAPIAAGDAHTCFVACDDLVHCSGSNTDGQSGRQLSETEVDSFAKPVLFLDGVPLAGIIELSAQQATTCGRRSTGDVFCWGEGFGELARLVPFLGGAEHIAAGSGAACSVNSAGRLSCIGGSLTGVRYDGPYDDVAVLGDDTVCVLATNQVLCCGAKFGVVGGNGASAACSSAPVALVFPSSPVSFWQLISGIVSSGNSLFGLFNGTSSVAGWGSGANGHLGQDNTLDYGVSGQPLSTLPTPAGTFGATQVVTSNYHSCIVIDGKVKCIGKNDDGQLGTSNTSPSSSFDTQSFAAGAISSIKVTFVAAGAAHTCGVLSGAGLVACWGSNSFGQSTQATLSPVLIDSSLTTNAGSSCRRFPISDSAYVGGGDLSFSVDATQEASLITSLGAAAPQSPYHLRWLLLSAGIGNTSLAGVPVEATGVGNATLRTTPEGAIFAVTSDQQPYPLAGSLAQPLGGPVKFCWTAPAYINTNTSSLSAFTLRARVAGKWVPAESTCSPAGTVTVISNSSVCTQICVVNVQLQIFQAVATTLIGDLPLPEAGVPSVPGTEIIVPGECNDGPASVRVGAAFIDRLLAQLRRLGLINVDGSNRYTQGVVTRVVRLRNATLTRLARPKPLLTALSRLFFRLRLIDRYLLPARSVLAEEEAEIEGTLQYLEEPAELCVTAPLVNGAAVASDVLLASYQMYLFDPLIGYVEAQRTCSLTATVARTSPEAGVLCSSACIINTDGFISAPPAPAGLGLAPGDSVPSTRTNLPAALSPLFVEASVPAVNSIFAALEPAAPAKIVLQFDGIPDLTSLFGVAVGARPGETATSNPFGTGMVLAIKQSVVPFAGTPFADTLGATPLVIDSPITVCWDAFEWLAPVEGDVASLTAELTARYHLDALVGGSWVSASQACTGVAEPKTVVGNKICTAVCWVNVQLQMVQDLELAPVNTILPGAVVPIIVASAKATVTFPVSSISAVYTALAVLLKPLDLLVLQVETVVKAGDVQNLLATTAVTALPLMWEMISDVQVSLYKFDPAPIVPESVGRGEPALGSQYSAIPYSVCMPVDIAGQGTTFIDANYKIQAFDTTAATWKDAKDTCVPTASVLPSGVDTVCANLCLINTQVRLLKVRGIRRGTDNSAPAALAPFSVAVPVASIDAIFGVPGAVPSDTNILIDLAASTLTLPLSDYVIPKSAIKFRLLNTDSAPLGGAAPVRFTPPVALCYEVAADVDRTLANLRVLTAERTWVLASTYGAAAGAQCGPDAAPIATPSQMCFWACAINTEYAIFVTTSATLISGPETFATALASQPPTGWKTVDLAPAAYEPGPVTQSRHHHAVPSSPVPAAAELWTFDNAGGLVPNAPIVEPFAAFDAFYTSNGNARSENSALVTPYFKTIGLSGQHLGTVTCVALTADHWIAPGPGSSGFVEIKNTALNGVNGDWISLAHYTDYTTNPARINIDITAKTLVVEGNYGLGARDLEVRFRWRGEGSFFWIVDGVDIRAQACDSIYQE